MNDFNTLAPGTILDNRYRIERILGQGGFGITYLATDIRLDCHVAIKEFFPKDYCDRVEGTSTVKSSSQSFTDFNERLRQKFVKEARHIAALRHPGIVSIMSAFDENGTSYYVMEIIDGGTFDSLIQQNGPMPLGKAVEYIHKIAAALEFVHSKRVNHLDIKPSNIMVRTIDDNPILIDFGLAKHYDREGRATTTTPVGMSHGFAPYEQYLENGVSDFSPETDIYSLAATLYYMLTGVVPPHVMTLIDSELTFPDNMPAEVRTVIAKAMSLNKPKRHHTVAEFVADLTAAISGKNSEATSPSTASETAIVQNRDNPNTEIEKYTKAAEQGDAEAQYRLGKCYYDGDCTTANHAFAINWWMQAAQKHHAPAMRSLARCYEFGTGVAKDLNEAKRLYEEAANKGDNQARQGLQRINNKLNLTANTQPTSPQKTETSKPKLRVYEDPSKQERKEKIIYIIATIICIVVIAIIGYFLSKGNETASDYEYTAEDSVLDSMAVEEVIAVDEYETINAEPYYY